MKHLPNTQTTMSIFYGKAMLYAYPNLDGQIKNLDDLIMKKGIASMRKYSPCEEQCLEIVKIQEEKCELIALQKTLTKILSIFCDEDLDRLDYTYFRQKTKDEYFEGFKPSCSAYYNRLRRLEVHFTGYLEEAGYNEEWFKSITRRGGVNSNFIRGYIRKVKDSCELKNKKGGIANKVVA